MKSLIIKDLIMSRIILILYSIAFGVTLLAALLGSVNSFVPFLATLGFSGDDALTSILMPAFFGMFVLVFPMIVEASVKYNELELTFPITKRDIVLSKYIEIAVITLSIMILAFVAYLCLHQNSGFDADEYIFVLDRFEYFPVVPCIVLILLSVVTPLIFRFGLIGALPLLLVPMASPALIIPAFAFSEIENGDKILTKLPVLLLIVAVAVYVASFFVSLRIMKRGRMKQAKIKISEQY